MQNWLILSKHIDRGFGLVFFLFEPGINTNIQRNITTGKSSAAEALQKCRTDAKDLGIRKLFFSSTRFGKALFPLNNLEEVESLVCFSVCY